MTTMLNDDNDVAATDGFGKPASRAATCTVVALAHDQVGEWFRDTSNGRHGDE